jgi:hypothetical protein
MPKEKQVHEQPLAFVSHKTRSRIRLKVPSKKKDHAFFTSLAEKMSSVEGVSAVEAYPLTGSILLLHSSDPDRVIETASAAGGIRFGRHAGTRTNLHRRVTETFEGIDVALRDATANELDVGGLAFLTLLGTGIYQIWRGNFTAIPWYAAGWYALNIFLKSNSDEQTAH